MAKDGRAVAEMSTLTMENFIVVEVVFVWFWSLEMIGLAKGLYVVVVVMILLLCEHPE